MLLRFSDGTRVVQSLRAAEHALADVASVSEKSTRNLSLGAVAFDHQGSADVAARGADCQCLLIDPFGFIPTFQVGIGEPHIREELTDKLVETKLAISSEACLIVA